MEAAAIEAQEEAGITPRNLEYCGYFDQRVLYENPIFHIICHFFVGEAGDPVERKTYPPEISDVGFFTEDSLPPLSMRRVRREEIRRLFAWRRGHRITMFE
jgi:8-oxo-dGTP pyrophosphatase MutT (NUDIX family)